MTIRIPAVLVFVGLMFAPASLAWQNLRNSDIDSIGVRVYRGQIDLESFEDTIALGRQLSQEFEQEVRIVADSTVLDYIDRLGQHLAEGTRILRFPLTFNVIDSAEVNALSLPGGFIYINTGTILAAESEAELASVIAHQIGHLAAGHGVELAMKLAGVNRGQLPDPVPFGFTYLEVVGRGEEETEWPDRLISVLFHRSARLAVPEADFLGVQYLHLAGYEARAATRFLERIRSPELLAEASDDKLGPLGTHPSIAGRIDAIEATIEAYLHPREQNIVTTDEFRSIQRRLAQ